MPYHVKESDTFCYSDHTPTYIIWCHIGHISFVHNHSVPSSVSGRGIGVKQTTNVCKVCIYDVSEYSELVYAGI